MKLKAFLPAAAFAVPTAAMALRALKMRPDKPSGAAETAPVYDAGAVERFQAMLRKKTVWPRSGEPDYAEFDSFLPLLKELYPVTFGTVEVFTVNKYGILLKWKGSDPSLKPVVTMAHYDVVSCEGQNWKYDPYAAEIHDGSVTARGTVDTKCIIGGVLEAFERLIKEGFTPKRDVYFFSTNNEETGGDTTPAVIEWFKERGVTPEFVLDEGGAVVSELPMGIRHDFAMIGVAEKGVADVIITAKGHGGHSSVPTKNDAPYKLVKALDKILSHPAKAELSDANAELLKNLARYAGFGMKLVFANLDLLKPLVLKVMEAAGGETNAMIRTTAALTKLSGSDTINTLPPEAQAGLSVRIAPGDTPQAAVDRIKALIGDGFDVRTEYTMAPSTVSGFDSDNYRLLCETVKAVYPGAAAAPYVMNGGTDSKHFTAICPDVYRFAGFRFTSAERASTHGENESLSVNAYLKGLEFYRELFRKL